MNAGSVIVRCPRCGARNRVPKQRWGERAICGKCKMPMDASRLFPDHPIEVSDASFTKEVLNFPGPVLAEFYSPR
jgi:thioredoxin 2